MANKIGWENKLFYKFESQEMYWKDLVVFESVEDK